MKALAELIEFLARHEQRLATAESCTCGLMASLLADVPGCGKVFDSGLVTYSEQAKRQLLGVRQQTIERFGLTSEEVAREMALGALNGGTATLVVANTGVADDSAEDPQGTQCFAYALVRDGRRAVLSETLRFAGDRVAIREQAARHGLLSLRQRYGELIERLDASGG